MLYFIVLQLIDAITLRTIWYEY